MFKHHSTHKSLLAFLPVLLMFLIACSDDDTPAQMQTPTPSPAQQEKSIVLLFENDVHCNVSGYVKFAGYRDAIVAADTEAHARAAADAVKVDIEQLPAYMNAMDAIAEDAIEIHPGTPNAYYETNCIKGPDFDFDSAPNVVKSSPTAPVSPTCIWSRTAATPTSTRTAWSPCTLSPSVSTCICP